MTTRNVDDLGLLCFALGAAGCCGWAAVRLRGRYGPEKYSWLALAVGSTAWAVGEGIWSYYEVYLGLAQTPFPSVADAGYLGLPVAVCLSLWLFPTHLGGQTRLRVAVDGVLVACSLFVVSWLTMIGGLVQVGAESAPALVVSLAYPITDVIILSMVVVIGAHARPDAQLTLALLGAGMAVMAVSDSAFVYLSETGSYASGNVIDDGWATGFTILAIAAAHRALTAPPGPLPTTVAVAGPASRFAVPGRLRLWFPYLPVLVAGTVGLPLAMPHLTDPAALAAVVLILVLVGRQLVALSDNRRLLQRLDHLAHHDFLTGLANRALFYHRLDRALHDHRYATLTVVCVDIDDFKQVNDTLGHDAGDELLKQVGTRLTSTFRGTDTVARLGGDEFAILVTTSTADHDPTRPGHPVDAAQVKARVQAAFNAPFRLADHHRHVRPSVGVATASSTQRETGTTSRELFNAADMAMYHDKSTHKPGRDNPAPGLQPPLTPRPRTVIASRSGQGSSGA